MIDFDAPWGINDDGDIADEGGELVAIMPRPPRFSHLIAAAPALYEALVLAAEELATIAVGMGEDGWSANDIERHESICAIGDRISAALAKARGDLVDPLEQVKL